MKKSVYVIGILIFVLIIGLFYMATVRNNKIELVEFAEISSLVQEYNKDYLFLYNGEIDDGVKDYIRHIKNNTRVA